MLGFESSKKLANDEKMASQFSNNFEAIAAIHSHKSRVYHGYIPVKLTQVTGLYSVTIKSHFISCLRVTSGLQTNFRSQKMK